MKTSRLTRQVLLISMLFLLGTAAGGQSMFDKVNDFDGDGRADFAVVRGESGLFIWYIWETTGGFRRVHWGISGDRVSAGDYDGDGKTDLGVGRWPSSNFITTYFLSSQTGTLQNRTVHATNAIYLNSQDYDGDGKADPACLLSLSFLSLVYHSSVTGFNVGNSLPGGILSALGDLTGDGRAEATMWEVQPGLPEVTVKIKNLSTNQLGSLRWGLRDDEFVAGDFDGDNKGDLTIFRKSTGDWWWIRSSDGVVNTMHWGADGDRPVAADYDGDGKTDQAVYRPGAENGVYYINGSQTGFQVFVWGIPGDFLVRYGDLNGVFIGS